MAKNKLTILIGLLGFVVLGAAALKPSVHNYENLQVLPQNITERKMDSLMESYNVSLGVKCNFCHVEAGGFKDNLNYASDNNHMKEEARKMMRLTMDINVKNFRYDTLFHPIFLNTVTCYTCHRGQPYPEQR